MKRSTIFIVVATLILGWTGWWGVKHIAWWTPAGHDIAGVVRGVIGVNETPLTPPQAYRNIPITAAEMSALSHMAQSKLADYYTGPSLSNWRNIAKQVLNPKDLHGGKTDLWMSHWRVTWVHLDQLTLLPGSADATASAEFQSNLGSVNRIDYSCHLVHTSAGWRVDREQSEFQLGYGP